MAEMGRRVTSRGVTARVLRTVAIVRCGQGDLKDLSLPAFTLINLHRGPTLEPVAADTQQFVRKKVAND